MVKPTIIVLSDDADDEFRWLSNGWYREDQRYLPENQRLFEIATRCMAMGSDVPDVKRRLEFAGFEVRPATTEEKALMADFPWK